MTKSRNARRTEVPIDYIAADPAGNRASRRLAAREAKAAKLGRRIGASTGGEPIRRFQSADDDEGEAGHA